MQLPPESTENYLSTIIFSDEATFLLNELVKRNNERIFGTQNPHLHATYKIERNYPKVDVFWEVKNRSVYGPFLYEGPSIIGQTYLEMLQTWLLLGLQVCEIDDFSSWRSTATLVCQCPRISKHKSAKLVDWLWWTRWQCVMKIIASKITRPDCLRLFPLGLRTSLAPNHGWTVGTYHRIHPSDYTIYRKSGWNLTTLWHMPCNKRGTLWVSMSAY